MIRAQINIVEVMDSWTVTTSLWDYSEDGGMDPIAGRSDTILASDYEQLTDPLGALWSVLHRVLAEWAGSSHL
jgi:hypothetical protein